MILRQSSNTHRKYCSNFRIRRLISTSSSAKNLPDAGLHLSPESIHDFPPQFTKAKPPFDAQSQLRPQGASPSPYLTQTPPKEHKKTTLSSFLNRPASLTLLPSPKSSLDPTSDIYYPKSQMHHTLAVIDACLYGLYDVPRARSLFNRLREERKGHPLLHVKLYNQVLYAYMAKAMTTSSEGERKNMLDEFWSLYDVLSHESEVKVTPCTYALAFLANLRFPNTVTSPSSALILARSPEDVLKSALENWVSLTDIVSDAYLMEAGAVMDAMRLISRTAVKIGNMDVVKELSVLRAVMQSIDSPEDGEGEKDGKGDPLEGIPEIKPVLKRSSNKGGKEDDMEPMTPEQLEQQIPFNLRNLRNRLLSTHRTRKLLSDPSEPEDPTATTDAQDFWTGSNSTPHLRQTHLETLTFTIAQTRIQHELGELKRASKLGELSMSKKGVRVLMWRWHLELVERIKAAMSVLKVQEEKAMNSLKEKAIPKSRAVSIHPFLSVLKPESLSFLTISHLLLLHGAAGVENGTKTTRAVLNIGKSIEQEYHAILARQIAPVSSTNALDDFSTESQPIPVDYYSAAEYRKLYEKRVTMRRSMDLDEKWTGTWTQTVRAKVGAFLIDLLMDCATVERVAYDEHGNEITETHPALYHSYDYVRGHKLGVIKLNDHIAARMGVEPLREHLPARHLPMLVRPKAWTDHESGGYLFNRSSVMRFKDSYEQQVYLREASAGGHMELLYAGLDVLGATPWKINKPVLEVVLQIWNAGEELAGIPPEKLDLEEPVKPPPDADTRERTNYIVRMQSNHVLRSNNHSERCNVNYKLEIARAFLGDVFYFPHNIDFRGRAYPLPPHLNHMGDDLSRGLLTFSEYRPLEASGLRWLKIHLANLYGYDKASFTERVTWCEAHYSEIRESARTPLEGERWWAKADDPWQCLATCIELTNALDCDDPTQFMSCLPIHQDGTCNGLQHYAALGGDLEGAKQVNLVDADKPSDVYTHVANLVEQSIAEDFEKGDKNALISKGKITRKVVKQTVMTTVYGVTFIGARAQIHRQLRANMEVPIEDIYHVAAYIAKKVMIAIGDLFSGANAIMSWLTLCAKVISKSVHLERLQDMEGSRTLPFGGNYAAEQMSTVIWTTPLGLPVVQPYRKTKRAQVDTALQTVYISDPNDLQEVNTRKQATAFPPNFIHSLDATHMMLTALECNAQNMTFASVHDSYWTHASTIDKMSVIIRETFISLHSSDVLGKLNDEFKKRYANHKVPLTALKRPQLIKLLKLAEQAKNESEGQDAEELIVKALRGEVAPAPHEDPALSAHERRRAKRRNSAEAAQTGLEEDEEADESDIEPDIDALTDSVLESDADTSERPDGKRRYKPRPRQPFDRRFIDLPALLPPLPQKGEFDVHQIKRSQYFFS